jgi:thioredoxin-like negative regulator of GroEL
MTTNSLVDVTSADQLQQVAAAHEHLLVYFWARWSEPCQLLEPVIRELLSVHSGLACAKVLFESFNHLHVCQELQ